MSDRSGPRGYVRDDRTFVVPKRAKPSGGLNGHHRGASGVSRASRAQVVR